jgi:alpha/beta superfamily hydrolase
MARKIETHLLDGPAGKLEALLEEPEDQEPHSAALVCHPHPSHGGTMHNKVVYRIARGLRRRGYVVLRFNYRGVNLSEGVYDHGEGELEDARTALTWLRERYPSLPYALAGFSFGSRIALRLACALQDAQCVIAVGFVSKYAGEPYLADCRVTRVFISSTNDEFAQADELRKVVEALPEPKRLVLVSAEDHFFKGALDEFENAVVDSVSTSV